MEGKRIFLSNNKGKNGYVDKNNNVFLIKDLSDIMSSISKNKNCEIYEELIEIGALFKMNDITNIGKILLVGNTILVNELYKYLDKSIIENIVINNYNIKDIDFAIYINFFEDYEELKGMNQVFSRNNIKWIKCIILEHTILLGPEFIPNESCCYECLYTRLISNESDFKGLIEQTNILKNVYKDEKFTKNKFNKSYLESFYKTIQVELINISNNNFNCINNEKEIDLWDLKITDNYILKVPGCDCNE